MKLGSKTINTAVIISFLGLLEQHSGLLTMLIGPDKTGAILMVAGAVMAGLRALTSQPLGDRYKKK